MKHRRSVEFMVLVAGIAVLDRGQMLHAAEMSAALGPQMYVAAMGEGHAHAAQGYLGIETRDVSEDQAAAVKLKEARGAETTNLDHAEPACQDGKRRHDESLQRNGPIVD